MHNQTRDVTGVIMHGGLAHICIYQSRRIRHLSLYACINCVLLLLLFLLFGTKGKWNPNLTEPTILFFRYIQL